MLKTKIKLKKNNLNYSKKKNKEEDRKTNEKKKKMLGHIQLMQKVLDSCNYRGNSIAFENH